MPPTSALIVIDGGHGEGGGALLRTALSMAAITQQPLRITNIRGNTRFQGIDAEDLTIIKALATSCAAEMVGAELGSKSLSFLPTRKATNLNGPLDSVRTDNNRGPNSLVVLTTLLPVLARTGAFSSVSVAGETYGHNALGFEAFSKLTLHVLRRMGIYAYPQLNTAGFGRESSGEVSLDVEPSVIRGLQWTDRGSFKGLYATITSAGIPGNVAARAETHLHLLANNNGQKIEVERIPVESNQANIYINVWAEYENGIGGGASIGARGLRVESLAQSAYEETVDWMTGDATLDPFLPDQILLPVVLSDEPSSFKISRLTSRFLTTVWVIKQFLPIHITVRGSEGNPGSVTVQR